jgi:outer membrane receptor for ferrienterochelin and colicins
VPGVDANPSNRSSVWTPLFHAVWKPDPKKRDQVRLSLTRSYRPPALGTLIARPTINRDAPVPGPNDPSTPDSVGNPLLKPELASGIDLAFERYLDGGGVLSANLFHREISNLMRNVLPAAAVPVSWSPGINRYVRQMQNIGDATTSGLEMDAKFRLDQIVTGAPGVELRANLSLYNSRVKAVPGPDNRLDQQAKATGNVGADYRLRGVPLTLGGNLNWTPAYTTKTDVGQFSSVTSKHVWDLYALWTFSPSVALRLLGNNLVPRDFTSTSISELPGATGNERTTVAAAGPSYVNWALRLELKL